MICLVEFSTQSQKAKEKHREKEISFYPDSSKLNEKEAEGENAKNSIFRAEAVAKDFQVQPGATANNRATFRASGVRLLEAAWIAFRGQIRDQKSHANVSALFQEFICEFNN